jgi:prephenate dehydrogenase
MEDTIQIAIVGLGVIGGSFAWALKEQEDFPVKLMGIDRDGRTLDQALAAGVIDRGGVSQPGDLAAS